jgi:hypothetical protein
MSDKEKPIQTPFDKTVPSIQQERGAADPGEERIREDLGLGDDGLSDPLEDAGEPNYADQDDQETYDEDYDSRG